MREMLRLASMEMRSENTNDISKFLTLFNEVLEQMSGIKGYKFNLRCFMCDEGGANYIAVRSVWGGILQRPGERVPVSLQTKGAEVKTSNSRRKQR